MLYSTASSSPIRKKMRTTDLGLMKKNGKKISSLTCYDSSFARLIDASRLDVVLVGDSLGNVIQGKKSTVGVTVSHIAYHLKCVASTLTSALLVGDMPFASAGVSKSTTMKNATALMQAGAEAVKIEGASPSILRDISFLTAHGIPVMGHIGLQPQSVHTVGGYKIQGKDTSSQVRLLEEAQNLQQAGCFAIVLELVEPKVAQSISQALLVPTIGIGSGNHCDGNILVLQDMLGMNSTFKPRFLKHYAQLEQTIVDAINSYCHDVAENTSEA